MTLSCAASASNRSRVSFAIGVDRPDSIATILVSRLEMRLSLESAKVPRGPITRQAETSDGSHLSHRVCMSGARPCHAGHLGLDHDAGLTPAARRAEARTRHL